MTLNYPESTEDAMRVLRSGILFEWYIVPLVLAVVFVYVDALRKGNRKAIAGGMALTLGFLSYQIANGLFQHFTGHALWTVPDGTAFLLLVGTPLEMLVVVGAVGPLFLPLLPGDPQGPILGISNRILFTLILAAIFAGMERLIAQSTALVWVYPWWGAIPAFLLVYMPLFTLAIYCYDWKPIRQVRLIGALLVINLVALVSMGPWLHWI